MPNSLFGQGVLVPQGSVLCPKLFVMYITEKCKTPSINEIHIQYCFKKRMLKKSTMLCFCT